MATDISYVQIFAKGEDCNGVIKFNLHRRGFTLIEIIVVIAILGVLAGIAVPRYSGFRNRTETVVCQTNLKSLERLFETEIVLVEIEVTNSVVTQFIHSHGTHSCPSGGMISYQDFEFECHIHHGEETQSEEDEGGEADPGDETGPGDDEVPFL